MIAARRPDSPLLAKPTRRAIVASASPSRAADKRAGGSGDPAGKDRRQPPRREEPARRAARIVSATGTGNDERERQRERLLDRLMNSDGRGAISRAADEYLDAGFDLPNEQEVHLQLLEHVDEGRARASIDAIFALLQKEPPLKRPVLAQRLRRLEEYADEALTRDKAAALRRNLRV